MIDEYSFKDSYTAAEISAVATKIEEEYNKTKEEEGNSYTKSL